MGMWLLPLAMFTAITVGLFPESVGIPDTARRLCEEAAIPFLSGITAAAKIALG